MNSKILYVDDEVINLQLLKINLRKHYDVITAESGLDGLVAIAQNDDIEIVISDMKMPVMNGLQFINEAKKSKADLQYYILSGYDGQTDIEDALKNKEISYKFSKPFNIAEIVEVIEKNKSH